MPTPITIALLVLSRSVCLLCSLRFVFAADVRFSFFLFADPTVAQSERKLSREEHQAFMRRYEEFQRNGWRVGTSWGLFSMALPSRYTSSLRILSPCLDKWRVKLLTCVWGTCVVVVINIACHVAYYRVGYQCANHYRKLLKEGKLNDNSFKLDPKGEVKLVEGADTRGHVRHHLLLQPQRAG